jgi:S-adenosylmethionine-diacylglycerol 3-amino-3-carboxypropyl transferase
MAAPLEERVSFDLIRYANCWEDAGILGEALKPLPGKRILSIASGGDNALALAAAGAEVVAADLSRAQLACCELKMAAVRRFDHPDTLAFLGLRPSTIRIERFTELRRDLSQSARDYWDAHRDAIVRGIVHAGRFENYFRVFRSRILPLVHGRRTVAQLLTPKDGMARQQFYNTVWNNWRWRLLFRIFFSRFMMGRLGRDPEFFRYVEGSVSDRILKRVCHALTVLPTHTNPYLDYILTGNFTTALPPYLEPDLYPALRAGLDRITLHQGLIQEAGQAHRREGFDGFNLSDIFEYLDESTSTDVYGALLAMARPGARFAYWNMLVPRACPKPFLPEVGPLPDLAASLFQKDRAFFYSAFVVDEVKGAKAAGGDRERA